MRFKWVLALPFVTSSLLFSISSAQPHTKVSCEYEQAEIKVPIDPKDLTQIFKAWDLKKRDATRSEIYFFDSKDLELYQQGWILRQRQVKHKDVETTLKYRHKDRIALPGLTELELGKKEDVKCEVDATLSSQFYSVSISDINTNSVQTPTLSLHQQDLLKKNSLGTSKPILALGPVKSRKWTYKSHNNLEINFELWIIGEDHFFAEASMKVETSKKAETEKELLKLLENIGVLPAQLSITKTAFTMDYFTKDPKK